MNGSASSVAISTATTPIVNTEWFCLLGRRSGGNVAIERAFFE
jgi:hypothetical protein